MKITSIIIDVSIVAVQADSIAEISLGRMDVQNALALSLVKFIHLSLTDCTLPVSQRVLVIERDIIGEITDGSLKITKYTMSDGPAHQKTFSGFIIARHTQLCREFIYHREYLQRTILIELLLTANDINLVCLGMLIERIHLLIISLNSTYILTVREIRELIHRQEDGFYLTVLNLATILALIVVFILRFVIYYQRSKLIRVNLRALTHLLLGLCAPSRLDTDMLVHLRLEDTEFIHFCLSRHTQATVTAGTVRQTGPEVRKLVDDRSIIPDGSSQITGFVMQ